MEFKVETCTSWMMSLLLGGINFLLYISLLLLFFFLTFIQLLYILIFFPSKKVSNINKFCVKKKHIDKIYLLQITLTNLYKKVYLWFHVLSTYLTEWETKPKACGLFCFSSWLAFVGLVPTTFPFFVTHLALTKNIVKSSIKIDSIVK